MLTDQERLAVRQDIEAKYQKVAASPQGLFRYPTGREGLRMLGYDPAQLGKLPSQALDGFVGVANPWSAWSVRPGERVLDVGCGAGLDVFIAALTPDVQAFGVDMSLPMLSRANLHKVHVPGRCFFAAADAERLPFAAHSFDAITSSGMLSLVPDKKAALAEMRRVLKPGGRIALGDQILNAAHARSREEIVSSWFR